MNVAIIGWAELHRGVSEGSGYNLVALEHAKYLIKSGHRVLSLSSGKHYTLGFVLKKNPPYIEQEYTHNGIEHFRVINSRNISPAQKNLSRTRFKISDPFSTRLIRRWIEEQRIQSIFIHSHEGYSLDLIPSLRKHVPYLKIFVFCHDHFYTCPRIDLMFKGRDICYDNDEGRKCIECTQYNRPKLLVPKIILRRTLIFKLYSAKERKKKAKIRRYFKQRGLSNKEYFTNRSPQSSNNYWGDRNLKAISALNNANLVYSPSTFLGDTLLNDGLHPHKLEVLRIGLPHLDNLRNNSISQGTKFNTNTKEVLRFAYRGTTQYRKGLAILLEALEYLSEKTIEHSEFLIWGVDESIDISEFHLPCNVTFFPKYNLADLQDHHSKYDVGILAHIWLENSPIGLLEHLASGKYVITPNLGGVSDYVNDHSNGVFFDAGDSRQLAKAISDRVCSTFAPRHEGLKIINFSSDFFSQMSNI